MEPNSVMAEKIEFALTELEREFSAAPFVAAVFGAFALYIAHNTPEETELKEILSANRISQSLAKAVTDHVGGHWEKYRPILTSYSQADLAEFFSVSVSGEHLFEERRLGVSSSYPIAELVVKLLKLEAGNSVCDLGCAAGDFMRRAYMEVSGKEVVPDVCGIEINAEVEALAEIRMICDRFVAKVERGSMFDRAFNSLAYDRVFCDAPFAVRGLPQEVNVRGFIEREFPDFPELNAAMPGDWLFAARAVAAMKKGGRAVVVLSPSVMFDGRNSAYRRYFVQRNLVEAVIELPSRLFAHTSIGAYLVVLSEGNESVKMVRAEELCYSNRKNNVLGQVHVSTIASCLDLAATCDRESLEKYRVVVRKADVLKDDCDLSVSHYFSDPEAVKNGVPFGSLVEGARRGAPMTSNELDDLVCEDETPYLYLAPGDINDGVLASGLPYLSELPDKYRPYGVKNGDLVITRVMASGADFKVAVVELPEGKTILANGNLIVISVDREKTDPYYIKACLDSAYAQRHLANCSVGSAVRTLSYKNLEKLPVPNLTLARQREIGKSCRESALRIVALREQYLAEKRRLGTMLEELAGECLVMPEE